MTLATLNFNTYGQVDTVLSSTESQFVVGGADTTQAQASFQNSDSLALQKDTIHEQQNDVSLLDIGSNRGIFILSSDRMMQLRILGSVRANFNYDNQDLENNYSFNPYDIPTDVFDKTPNFFAGVQQTRLGFEVTRRTATKGDIFIRIEGDFNSSAAGFRLRHAYGQFMGITVGQTWSVFNNVSFQPVSVSQNGPAGGMRQRAPQIRFSKSINQNLVWNAAIEYSSVNIVKPDTVNGEVVQAFPDLTGRFVYKSDLISFQLAGLISTVAGRIDSNAINYALGFGLSVAGSFKIKENSILYFSMTSGRSMSQFIDLFVGKNEIIAYDPESDKFAALFVTSGYLAYSYRFPGNFSMNASFGIAGITNKDFQPEEAFNFSYNVLVNVFWEPVSGARLGLEFATGRRYDRVEHHGSAQRLSILTYYDF